MVRFDQESTNLKNSDMDYGIQVGLTANVIYDNFSVKWNGKKMSVQQWTVTCNLATGGKPKTQTVHGAVHKVIFKGINNRLFDMLT